MAPPPPHPPANFATESRRHKKAQSTRKTQLKLTKSGSMEGLPYIVIGARNFEQADFGKHCEQNPAKTHVTQMTHCWTWALC